ncbi:MAG: hypothetical protein L6R40_006281 [Gallowayella cf. fulva]|nr:MAG: hypothetical protein L6R40_006281 [Xanthomendoza cf. fulva]
MPQDDVSGSSFQKRLRNLAFSRSGSGSPGKAAIQPSFDDDQEYEFKLKHVAKISSGQPLQDRLDSLLAAAKQILRCSSSTVLAILDAADDLFDDTANLDSRNVGFAFLTNIARAGHLDQITRAKTFNCITRAADPSSIASQISAIDALTDHGNKVAAFQPLVTDFVAGLLSRCYSAADRSRAERRSKSPGSEEKDNLETVWTILEHLMLSDALDMEESHSSQLLNILITICRKTTARSDLDRAIAVIGAFTARAKVPNENLDPLINVLCSISYARGKDRAEIHTCLDHVFIKSDRSIAMGILLRNLSQIFDEPNSIKEMRGSLLQLEHIYKTNGVGANLGPRFAELVQALKNAATVDHGDQNQNQITLTLSLKATAAVVRNEMVIRSLISDDWACMEGIVEIIAKAAGPIHKAPYQSITRASPIYFFACGTEIKSSVVTEEMIEALHGICRGLSRLYPRLTPEKRTLVVNVFLFLGNIAEPNTMDIVIDHVEENRLLLPPNENWLVHIAVFMEKGFLDNNKHPLYRARVLNLISEVHKSVCIEPRTADIFGQQFVKLIQNATIGSSLALINQLVDLLCKSLVSAGMLTFDLLLAALVDLAVRNGSPDLTLSAPTTLDDRVNTTSLHLIHSFLECLPDQPQKARKIYDSLVAIAKNPKSSIEAKLDSIQLLTRLRCNSDGVVQVIQRPDTQSLAPTLSKMQAANGPPSGSVQSNRASLTEGTSRSRSSRNSGVVGSHKDDARSRPQSAVGESTELPNTAWKYSSSQGTALNPLKILATEGTSSTAIDPSSWLELVLEILEKGSDWEPYSYILIHLPSQLTNISLFANCIPQIEKLHDLLLYQLQKSKFLEPPAHTELKKGHIALCLYQMLTVMVGYSGWFLPQKKVETVHTFLVGTSQWSQTIKCCIHALALCCHELPRAVDRCLSLILTKMSQIITQSQFAIDILEFLTRLSRLPAAYQSIGEEPLRSIFGICIRHLHHSREMRQIATDSVNLGSANSSKRCSNISGSGGLPSDLGPVVSTEKELPEYVYALAYHVITHWFLAIPIQDRSKHVGWIAKNLAWKDKFGEEIVEEQSQVTLDMMHRTAYLDLGETVRPLLPTADERSIIKKMYLVGMSVITLETDSTTGLTHITKRQASGTTNATYQPCIAPLPAHHVGAQNQPSTVGTNAFPSILPQHVLLQLSSTISPMPIPTQPIVLPDDGSSDMAIRGIDQIATVDSYKAGVIYVAKGQQEEKEILANSAGSEAFDSFLAGLGTKVVLQGATFNTSGLDKVSNMDGTHTFAWRDRVTEIVFHVPSMMPNVEHDPQCTNKKKHTGNDFVNIIFNESELPFQFDTFPSALNFVNIVITPEKVTAWPSPLQAADNNGPGGLETCYFFKVQVLSASFLPEISPAASPKVVSASALPSYVRQLALNAHLFSLVWSERAQGEEVISSWRSRLRHIRKLRQKYANTGNSANVGYPEMGTAEDRGGAKSYEEGDDWKGTLAMGGLAEQGQSLMSLDFTRWT